MSRTGQGRQERDAPQSPPLGNLWESKQVHVELQEHREKGNGLRGQERFHREAIQEVLR